MLVEKQARERKPAALLGDDASFSNQINSVKVEQRRRRREENLEKGRENLRLTITASPMLTTKEAGLGRTPTHLSSFRI